MRKLFFMLAGILMPLLFGCTNAKASAVQEEEASNLFDISKPAFEKFVVVNSEESVPIYQKADKNSPVLCRWMEDIESDMADVQYQWSDKAVPAGYISETDGAWPGAAYAVLGEEGDFYIVNILNEYSDIEAGYLLKEYVSDVSAEPITTEKIEEIPWQQSVVIRDGKYKNLVLTDNHDELWGESMEVGVMLDGCVAYPFSGKIYCDLNTELDKPRLFTEENTLCYQYPQDKSHECSEDGFEEDYTYVAVDLKKLSDEEKADIFETVLKRPFEKVRFEYSLPMGLTMVFMNVKD